MITKAQRTVLRKILLGRLEFIDVRMAHTLSRKKLITYPLGDRVDPKSVALTAAGRRLADIKSIDHQAPGGARASQ